MLKTFPTGGLQTTLDSGRVGCGNAAGAGPSLKGWRHMWMMSVAALALALSFSGELRAAKYPVPSVDAGVGACSVEFAITDQNFRPVYDAQIRVRFRYGIWGTHRISLQVGTDSAGKARVDGLPEPPRHPLDFSVRDSKGSAHWIWTGLQCNSHVQLALHRH